MAWRDCCVKSSETSLSVIGSHPIWPAMVTISPSATVALAYPLGSGHSLGLTSFGNWLIESAFLVQSAAVYRLRCVAATRQIQANAGT